MLDNTHVTDVPPISDAEVAEIAGQALHLPAGTPPAIRRWQATALPRGSGAPATGGLYRIRGTCTDGATFSIFVKQIHHVRHWRQLTMVPANVRESFARRFPWRQELAAWDDTFAGRLPDGLRVPALYRISDLGDDRLLVWMEDIDAIEQAWPITRYQRAAYLLGGLAALRSTPEVSAASARPRGAVLSQYAAGRVGAGVVPLLHTDSLWRHPLLAQAADERLRDDLIDLAGQLPRLAARLAELPVAMPHGDACPQNLLVPRSDPDTLVAIDISMQSPMPLGFDLGQLLIGHVHAGLMPAAHLPAVHELLLPAYQAGLHDHGVDAAADEVLLGYTGSLLIRAGFTSLPFEMLGESARGDSLDEAERAHHFRERAALTRFIIDHARTTLQRTSQ
jgi:hypothetical protein